MDNKKVIRMANKIAENDEPLIKVDQAINSIISSIYVLDENLPLVATKDAKEKQAINKIKDLMDSAIAPYMADIAKAYLIFEDE
jgi:hypothetical protein